MRHVSACSKVCTDSVSIGRKNSTYVCMSEGERENCQTADRKRS